jgi:hypothetical protein
MVDTTGEENLMKIRTDFVTNSSSTSYCIIGVPTGEVSKVLSEDYSGDDIWEKTSKEKEKLEKTGLLVALYQDGHYGMVGLSIEDIKEDETFKQFKERVLTLLQKTCPDAKIQMQDIEMEVNEFNQ